MQSRLLKELSEQELAAVRKSEEALTRYVATVSEIQTYRVEAEKLTREHDAVPAIASNDQLEVGVERLRQRAHLFALEKKAMAYFTQHRNGWLNTMLPEHQQKVMAEIDPLVQVNSGRQLNNYGTLFAGSAKSHSGPEIEQKEESTWSCSIQ